MKRLLVALLFLIGCAVPAMAQCNGIFSAGQVCGSVSGGFPGPISLSGVATNMVVGTSPVTNGTNGFLLYDASGLLGATTTGTGVLTALGNNVNASGGFLTFSNLPWSLANGGSGAALTASNGGIIYSTASAMAILGGTVTAGQCLLSGSNSAPTWGVCSGGSSGVSSVNNADSTLTVAGTGVGPFTGNVTAKINLGNTNTWTAAQTITTNSGNFNLDTPGATENVALNLKDNGALKWSILNFGTSGDLFDIFDETISRNDLVIAPNGNMQLMPSGGNVEVGGNAPTQLFTVANVFGADASGHPWCDPRTFGAASGVGSTDQTAIANALSTCSGGHVNFSCGNYLSTAGWSLGVSTAITGQGEGCVQITTSQTNGTVFTCGSSVSNTFERFADITIIGPGTVTTGGYGIDCSSSGNQQHYERVHIIGTFNGINVGGTNCTITQSRIENLYGTVMINEPNGGCQITHNQFDNDSSFNQAPCTGGVGGLYGVGFATYNRSVATAYAQGTIATDGSYYYCAVQTGSGTSGPQAGGLVPHTHGTTFTDGTVTWITIGNNTLTLINAGTETWVAFNDMTSPAKYGILCNGSIGGKQLYSYGNDIVGELGAGIAFENGCTNSRSIGDVFGYIGSKGEYAVNSSGFAIWDQSSTDSQTTISSANFFNIPDACILLQSSRWVLNANVFNCNAYSSNFYNVDDQGSTATGLTITGNDFNGPNSIHSVSGSSRVTCYGNTLYGGTITMGGSSNNCVAGNNN